MLEVDMARDNLKKDYTQNRLKLMNAVHAGGGGLGMDRYFNVYHYLPEVDPARLYVEPNYRADGSGKTLHKNSDNLSFSKLNVILQYFNYLYKMCICHSSQLKNMYYFFICYTFP